MNEPIPRGRTLGKPKTARVTYDVWTAVAGSEEMRLRTELRRVAGQSYWRTDRHDGKTVFTIIVPTREELRADV